MDLVSQAETFATLMATGAVLGFFFDFYRVLRGIHKPRNIVTAFGDLIYWLIATVIAGGALLYSNWGEMRLYVILALLAGAGCYFRLFSRFAIRGIIYCVRWLNRCISWVKLAFYYLVIKPVCYPARLLAIPLVYAGKRLRQWCRLFEPKDDDPPV